MKKLVTSMIVAAAVIIVLLLYLHLYVKRANIQPIADHGWGGAHDNTSNDLFAICKSSPRFEHSRVRISEAESNSVIAIYKAMEDAYAKGQTSVLRLEMARVPDVMTNVYDSVYIEIERPLATLFRKQFLHVPACREFKEVREFERYVEINLLMARFEGEMMIKRGKGTGLVTLEVGPLRLLTKYKAKYHAEGKADFERAADRFLAELKESIDSEKGFTRWYMWFQVDLQWPHVGEGGWTAQTVENFVKEYAKPLINLGHTPKWLHEFDNLQEPEWSKEWDAKHGIRR